MCNPRWLYGQCNMFCLSTTALLLTILLTFAYTTMTSTSLTNTGNGYTAHLSCTILFGTPRPLHSAKVAEFIFPPVVYGRIFTVDQASQCVTTSAILRKDLNTTYCWVSNRLGCARMGTITTPTPETPEHLQTHAHNIQQALPLPFPLGETVPVQDVDDLQQQCLAKVARSHFEEDPRLHSRALVVLQNNQVLFEKYKTGWDASTRLHGWSMTKSMLNALIGIRVRQQQLTLDTTLDQLFVGNDQLLVHPENRNITVFDLLTMSDGMDIDEVYLPGSKVVKMLFESPSVLEFGQNITRRPNGSGCFQYSSLGEWGLVVWWVGGYCCCWCMFRTHCFLFCCLLLLYSSMYPFNRSSLSMQPPIISVPH